MAKEVKGYSIIGKRLPRVDGRAKVTGEALYGGDMVIPRMLYGKIFRSKYPHAKILRIDISKAERLPGVKSVITGKDTPGIKYAGDKYALAMDKVRYIGDEVAAVAAIDEDTTEEAMDLIEVDYEELPAIFDPEEAMGPEAPKIHDVNSNIGATTSMNFGDIEMGFQQSYYIRQDRFVTQPTSHCPLEPHTALASFDSSGKLTVWSSTQSPYFTYLDLARTLNIPKSQVRVIKPFVGGGFGGKAGMFPHEFCAALLSKKSGKPVKIIYNREEVFINTRQRHPMIIELKTGVNRDGTLVAKECKLIADGGAYNSIGPMTIYMAGAFLNLPYRLPNFRYRGYRVYTNKPVCGAQRGHGTPQVRFADDSQIDMMAMEIGMDPVELRLKNAIQANDILPNKFRITSCGFTECLESVTMHVGWKDKWGKLPDDKGIGVGCNAFVSGARVSAHNSCAAFIRVHEDGIVTLLTGASDIGQGSDTVLAQIVAEEMGIALEDIRITSADTEITPIDPGTFSSRVTFAAGNAVKAAAIDAKQQILQAASERLEVSVEDIAIKDRWVYVKGSPGKGMSFSDLLKACQYSGKGKAILGKGYYGPDLEYPNLRTGEGNLSRAYSFGAQVAEVRVDKETGQVKVAKMTAAHDCGFAINPMAVEGQLEGSISCGMGQALSEELLQEKGQILNPSFLGYKLFTSLDMPEIKTILIETIDPEGPFGAKEAGEGTQISPIPAIANAIHDAIGVRIENIPIIPEKILEALEKRE